MSAGAHRIYAAQKLKHLGEILMAGHLFLIKNYSGLSEIKENFDWYHLQGDPSLLMKLKAKPKRKLTESEKEVLRNRLAKARSMKKNKPKD